MSRNRRAKSIRLGLDYGTSASKIAYYDETAPGGPKTYIACFDQADCRFPATVRLDAGSFYFGRDALAGHGFRYESLKMRAAREIDGAVKTYCHTPPLPEGFSARNLVTLSLWWLMSKALEALCGRYSFCSSLADFDLRFRLGIPVEFVRRPPLKAGFEEMGGVAWELFRRHERFPAMLSVTMAHEELDKVVSLHPPPAALEPEAKAALMWTIESPELSTGPYLKIDVGAGTTNASAFRLVDSNVNRRTDKVAVFGSSSVAAGMDWIDELLLQCLGKQSYANEVRGAEAAHLSRRDLLNGTVPALDGIAAAGAEAWRARYQKSRGSITETRAFDRDCRVFVLGGGSLIEPIRNRMRMHPFTRGRSLPAVELGWPPDCYLDHGRNNRNALPFCLVAYGLAHPDIEMLQFQLPEEIPTLAEPEVATQRCPCGGVNEDCPICSGSRNAAPEVAFALDARPIQAVPVSKRPQEAACTHKSEAELQCLYCSAWLPSSGLSAHLYNCLMRAKPVAAQQLDQRGPSIVRHRVVLDGRFVRCPNCSARVSPSHLSKHLRSRCPGRAGNRS